MYSFSRTEGWYDGRPVAASSTPSKLISAKSNASTKTSITRTGLLSSMKSSMHSGKSVHCPRSASSTKRLIKSPAESRGNHNTGTALPHSQGKNATLQGDRLMSASHLKSDFTGFHPRCTRRCCWFSSCGQAVLRRQLRRRHVLAARRAPDVCPPIRYVAMDSLAGAADAVQLLTSANIEQRSLP